MRMRKPLAMIAALATLLGGMAFSAASAQANDGDTDKTVNTVDSTTTTQLDGAIVLTSDDVHNLTDGNGKARQFKYVKLASYELTPDATTGPNLTLVTPDNLRAPVESAIKSLDDYANTDFTGKGDPLAWFASQTIDAKDWRAFISNLKNQQNLALSESALQPGLDATAKSLTFGTNILQGPGLYLLVDQTLEYTTEKDSTTNCTTTYGPLIDILIGTRITTPAGIANSDGTLNLDGKTPDGQGTIPNGASGVKTTKHNNCYPDFGFVKKGVGKDSDALQGAVFTIKKLANVNSSIDENNFDSVFDGSDRSIKLDDNFPKNTTVTSDVNGKVVFSGLDVGKYVIKETTTPNSYLIKYAARLVLTVTQINDGNSANKTLEFKLEEIGGNNLLSGSGAATDPYVYKNIQNITQLPKTGAEGIALFFVIAALLAGAGVTVFVKSRSTKRMLNA